MTKEIIVGIDPYRPERSAVDLGAIYARATGASLALVGIYPYEAGKSVLMLSDYENMLRTEAQAKLEEIQASLPKDVASIVRTIGSVSPARALQHQAEQDHAALVIVGSTQKGPLGRVFVGSTGERLLHGSPCPVIVTSRDEQPRESVKTIGVAYIDTPEGKEALSAANSLALRLKCEVRLLTVYESFVPTDLVAPFGPIPWQPNMGEVEQSARSHVESMLNAAREELDPSLAVEVEIMEGGASSALLDATKHLDLLLCGSRGYGPVGSVLLGSLSKHLVRDASCPVMVVPRGGATALQELRGSVTN